VCSSLHDMYREHPGVLAKSFVREGACPSSYWGQLRA
jgi:hypothetical protein